MKLRNKKTGDINEAYLIVDEPGIRRYAESIKDLCDHYEDYTPTEPLIKDEKIRKAVRAWWNAIDNKEKGLKPHVDIDEDSGVIDIVYTADIHIEFRNINTAGKLYGYYTITELCGEE